MQKLSKNYSHKSVQQKNFGLHLKKIYSIKKCKNCKIKLLKRKRVSKGRREENNKDCKIEKVWWMAMNDLDKK